MKDLQVESGTGGGYRIVFRDTFEQLPDELLRDGIRPDRIAVVCDSNTGPLYLRAVTGALEATGIPVISHTWPAGEKHKTLETVCGLYDLLLREGFSRKSLLIALGGGVTCDMTGFAAATYMRGIRFVQLPTTLLAQVDASVGGKTGFDWRGYKNMIGAFHMPSLVYMNLRTLETLDGDEYRSGLAEAVKTAVLGDRAFFDLLCGSVSDVNERENGILKEIVARSCAVKRRFVEEDPTERGRRMYLNLGHTIGHAIEITTDFAYAHGACVSLGLAAAVHISAERGMLGRADAERITSLQADLSLPIRAEFPPDHEILRAMRSDKKASGGRVRFVLLKGIGECCVADDVSDDEIRSALGSIRGIVAETEPQGV